MPEEKRCKGTARTAADYPKRLGDHRKPTGSISSTGLTVIGQIEGHYILPAQNKTTKYEHVIPQLVAIEQDPEIEGLIVILNTGGR